MRKLSTLLISLLLSAVVFSQTKIGRISGVITDESQKPVQSASVSLLRAKDSSLVKIAVTNKEGKYEFENIIEGKFLLLVSSVGFQKKFGQSLEITTENSTFNAETIKLSADAKSMQEVTVTAKKPFIETKKSKLKCDWRGISLITAVTL